jgi:hypothetical protein
MGETKRPLTLTISNLLSAILREDWAALDGAMPTAAAWDALLEEAQYNALTPVVYALLRRADYLDRLPPAVARALQKASARTAVDNALRLRALAHILAALAEEGITPILLKGISLLHTVYRQPNMRPMVDMDIMVLADELQPALDCLQRGGYRPVYPEQFPGAYEVVTHHIELVHPEPTYGYLELHHYWLDVPEGMKHASVRELRQRAQTVAVGQSGYEAYVLGVEDQILQMAAHAASHSPATVHWLWFYDLLQLIRTYEDVIDWDVTLDRASAYQLVLPLQWVLPLLHEQLAAPIPPSVLARLASLPVTKAEKSRFAPDRRGGQTRLVDGLQKLRSGSWQRRVHFAWSLLFPQWHYMQAAYPADNGLKLIVRYPLRWLSVLREAWLAWQEE